MGIFVFQLSLVRIEINSINKNLGQRIIFSAKDTKNSKLTREKYKVES